MKMRSDGVTWQEIDGELVLLDLSTSAYLTTNAAGSLLAKVLVDGAERGDLVAALVGEYGIDEARAAGDVDDFLEQLRSRDLLLESESK
ncbi:PqqD family protein [Isoptericola sp. NEAU-Y5]|uniref:PqqD family protein n=1 Tax=Isoptericola luteus TaxID=2879484 RepID=A0ABS7ZCV4_9MICO|nr:PqqD family protein [Isoptericola sp. NEAU-Y5]MCA5892868.1 PqqD family protein [Isoptericola sp. NEAU-Y5]